MVGVPLVSLWFPFGFPLVSLWFPFGVPLVSLWFPFGFPFQRQERLPAAKKGATLSQGQVSSSCRILASASVVGFKHHLVEKITEGSLLCLRSSRREYRKALKREGC